LNAEQMLENTQIRVTFVIITGENLTRLPSSEEVLKLFLKIIFRGVMNRR
jgi:hypothetical protein